VLHHLVELARQVPPEQLHEAVDLARWPVPVLRREREEREVLDAEPSCRFDDRAHRILADAVAVQARESALLGPASVAVHDDRDVAR
jgi:hypothetical protein